MEGGKRKRGWTEKREVKEEMKVKIGVTFQRFVFRTSKRIDTVQNLAAKKKQELAEQVKDISKHFKEFDKYLFLGAFACERDITEAGKHTLKNKIENIIKLSRALACSYKTTRRRPKILVYWLWVYMERSLKVAPDFWQGIIMPISRGELVHGPGRDDSLSHSLSDRCILQWRLVLMVCYQAVLRKCLMCLLLFIVASFADSFYSSLVKIPGCEELQLE
ncbi:hypothetical protein C5167_005507 [Papaver somniferum]|uniref:Uncharacterized protein n=1 Tax=Papaver somniferum TaxID=3469 RepID=A0A4Y7JDT6_PAPSO|nr:hypothetical protein C5167_005507 [Papaver somniferum]